MDFSASGSRGTDKAVWGRAVLLGLFALFVVSATSVDAAKGKGPRHAKLDSRLNELADQGGDSSVIIEFNDETDAVNLVKSHGGKSGRRLAILNARVATVSNRKLKLLANDPRVKRIHLDRPATGMVGRTAVTVGARAVQELMGYTGAGIGVAIVDSGITAWHDDLTSASGQGQRVAHFVDFVNGYTQLYDDWGHGTHVAGIVAGNGVDSNGARNAIAPGAHIVALKALDASGNGTISTIIAAIDYAVANRNAFNIRVINLSLGASVVESYHTDPLTLAAKRAVDAGIVVVAAAGNQGKAANGQPQYGAIVAPGNAPWVITVGASSTNGTVLRQDDTIAAFSSRGPTKIDYAAKPDLVAPGFGTISLSDPVSSFYTAKAQFLLGGLVPTSYAPYLTLSGTSMATPVVAGTAALMLQANPNLTPNLVKAILQFTAQEYPGYDALTQGTGFLNARGAVMLAEYFRHKLPGSPYPQMKGWSRQIFWGNRRIKGGVLTPGGTAWAADVVWGDAATLGGGPVVWGENCVDVSCDTIVWGNNIVWGNGGDDNIVWGNTDDDNIVWGNSGEDNIVWGNSDGDNIVWGNSGDDNIVWGNNGGDNIVWGNTDDDNIVWGNSGEDNIVWGNNGGDNIVWGNSSGDDVPQVAVVDETTEVNSLPASFWDCMFQLDASWSGCTAPPTSDITTPASDEETEPTPPPADTSGQTGEQQ